MSTVDDDLTPRPALAGDLDVDVAIVGAGYTGLWTALLPGPPGPGLRIAVLEAEIAGFGASGPQRRLVLGSVPAVGRRRWPAGTGGSGPSRCTAPCSTPWTRSGRVADGGGHRLPLRQGRHGRARPHGGPVGPGPARSTRPATSGSARTTWRCSAPTRRGALRRHRRARRDVHPALRGDPSGSAGARPGRGRRTARRPRPRADPRHADRPRAGAHRPRRGAGGRRGAGHRGLHAALPGPPAHAGAGLLADDRDRAAAGSVWDGAGLAARETFSRPPAYDHLRPAHRRRPARVRRAGRAVPLRLARRPDVRPGAARARRLRAALRELFPADRLASRGSRTGGAGRSASPRDWTPRSGCDRTRGLAWARRLRRRRCRHVQPRRAHAGGSDHRHRTRADRLPWVGHRSPRWEPEPLRWLGINAGLRVMASADRAEARTGRPSRRAGLFGRLLGELSPACVRGHARTTPRTAPPA